MFNSKYYPILHHPEWCGWWYFPSLSAQGTDVSVIFFTIHRTRDWRATYDQASPRKDKKYESWFCTTTSTWLEHSKVQTWWFSFTLDRVFRPCETGLNLNIKWKKPSLESCCKRTFRNIELSIDCFVLEMFSSYTIHKLRWHMTHDT